MRSAFFESLAARAAADDRIYMLTGDLGFGVVEPFMAQFPGRFLNVGVAEQNMTGLATGLALSGKVVFTYSIANFPTLRCIEQIRNGPCYHNVDVKVVAVGGGLSYGALGMSHHATEDLAVMRALPNMTVLAPGDPIEARWATQAAIERKGPVYLRLGRQGEPAVHAAGARFEFGRAALMQEGRDLTIISIGGMLGAAVRVAAALDREGIHARVLSMHTLKPIDEAAVIAAGRETPLVVTIEEHSMIGGLGSAVAEILAERDDVAPLKRIALPSGFVSRAGSRDYLIAQYGLSDDAIVGAVRKQLEHVA